jgi:hypothetical protein
MSDQNLVPVETGNAKTSAQLLAEEFAKFQLNNQQLDPDRKKGSNTMLTHDNIVVNKDPDTDALSYNIVTDDGVTLWSTVSLPLAHAFITGCNTNGEPKGNTAKDGPPSTRSGDKAKPPGEPIDLAKDAPSQDDKKVPKAAAQDDKKPANAASDANKSYSARAAARANGETPSRER